MRKETMMRGRRGFRGGCYGGGGDLMGFLAIILMAIIALPLVGGFILVTGKETENKVIGGVILIVGIILWAVLGIR